MGDDGLGIHVINLLKKEKLPDYVELVDGGTKGLNLINYFEGKDIAIIVDAIDLEKEPGDVIVLKDEEIRKYFHVKYSVHEIGIIDLLDTATLLEILPEHVILIGMQPHNIELTTDLSESIKKGLPNLINNIKQFINA